jgi:hypothetical protein
MISRANRSVIDWLAAAASLLLVAACSHPAADSAAAGSPAARATPTRASSATKADDSKKTADAAPDSKANAEDGAKDAADKEVKLSQEDVAKMGIAFTNVTVAQYTPETEGYGVIMAHDAVAQAVADAGTAEAMSRQSHAALARIERLAGTPGAETIEAHEAAQRQAAADQIAVALAQRKLSSLLGQRPPWTQGDDRLLQDVASGRIKVARVTFPLGTIKSGTPRNLRIARLDALGVEEQWRTHTVWPAPADATMPGRSYFALLSEANVDEGARLSAWTADGNATPEDGAWVPAAAAVVDGGRYWCYLQREPGTFERTPLDISRPLRDGYFVSDLKAGDSVVSIGAGLLLARELNPESEAD